MIRNAKHIVTPYMFNCRMNNEQCTQNTTSTLREQWRLLYTIEYLIQRSINISTHMQDSSNKSRLLLMPKNLTYLVHQDMSTIRHDP